jgi:hypothetical protein
MQRACWRSRRDLTRAVLWAFTVAQVVPGRVQHFGDDTGNLCVHSGGNSPILEQSIRMRMPGIATNGAFCYKDVSWGARDGVLHCASCL